MNNISRLLLITPVLILANPLAAMASDTFATKNKDATATAAVKTEDGPIKLDISGHMKMYGNYADQDGDIRAFDILRDTDVTFAGETTLNNGITIGAVVNADGDGGDGFAIEDSFIFASGEWGRVSLGLEDGAAFLLQVSAPSADDNVDGVETFVNPINFADTGLAGTNFEGEVTALGLDYDNDLTAGYDKITYLTPMFSGFQAGVSYTPDSMGGTYSSRGLGGNATNDVLDELGSAWEGSVRYEGKISDDVSFTTGAGYATVLLEDSNGASTVDDYDEWNAAIDFDIGAFGIGAVYTENNGGLKVGNDSETIVLGVDYTVGPVKYGASWLNNTHEESATEEIEADRFAVGVVYEYGPGLSFRGSVSHVSTDVPASVGDDVDGTAVTIGTQILF